MVDHYKVVRLLGRGGFGEVYLARDAKLGRKIALKLLNTSHFGSEEAAKRVKRPTFAFQNVPSSRVLRLRRVPRRRWWRAAPTGWWGSGTSATAPA